MPHTIEKLFNIYRLLFPKQQDPSQYTSFKNLFLSNTISFKRKITNENSNQSTQSRSNSFSKLISEFGNEEILSSPKNDVFENEIGNENENENDTFDAPNLFSSNELFQSAPKKSRVNDYGFGGSIPSTPGYEDNFNLSPVGQENSSINQNDFSLMPFNQNPEPNSNLPFSNFSTPPPIHQLTNNIPQTNQTHQNPNFNPHIINNHQNLNQQSNPQNYPHNSNNQINQSNYEQKNSNQQLNQPNYYSLQNPNQINPNNQLNPNQMNPNQQWTNHLNYKQINSNQQLNHQNHQQTNLQMNPNQKNNQIDFNQQLNYQQKNTNQLNPNQQMNQTNYPPLIPNQMDPNQQVISIPIEQKIYSPQNQISPPPQQNFPKNQPNLLNLINNFNNPHPQNNTNLQNNSMQIRTNRVNNPQSNAPMYNNNTSKVTSNNTRNNNNKNGNQNNPNQQKILDPNQISINQLQQNIFDPKNQDLQSFLQNLQKKHPNNNLLTSLDPPRSNQFIGISFQPVCNWIGFVSWKYALSEGIQKIEIPVKFLFNYQKYFIFLIFYIFILFF